MSDDQHPSKRGALDEEDLCSFVSFTSRLVAAARAAETAETDSLFSDHLAHDFAGQRALEYLENLTRDPPEDAKPWMVSLPPEAEGRKRRVGVGTVRTLYFDQAILAACRGQDICPGTCQLPVRQVVMLGAGLDARPWRLALPADVRWFEVDQPDVVRAKKALLGKMGAAIEAADNAAARFPLTAASVHWLSADLQLAGWPQALAVSGLDATRPVLWHAEGLLNYLTPNAVQNLLAEASKACAPGSVLTATMIADSTIAKQRDMHPEAHMRDVYQQAWGAPTPPEQTTKFMRSCGWDVKELLELAEAALRVAPGFEHNCGPLHKQEGDFMYFLMIATSVQTPAAHKGSSHVAD